MTIFVPRSTWHPGLPTNNDGTTRPRLARPVEGGIAVHYEGAPIRARNSTDSAAVYMTRLQSMAQAGRKSFEYNYVNPPRADGSSQIWEYAGDYMAAHAGAVNNPRWVSVLFAIGVDNHPSYSSYDPTGPTVWQPVSDAQVESFHWLVARLVAAGAVKPGPDIREHRHLAGAATTCPGDGVRGRWSELADWFPDPQPPSGVPMHTKYFIIGSQMPATLWATDDERNATRVIPGQYADNPVPDHQIERRPRETLTGMRFQGLPIESVR